MRCATINTAAKFGVILVPNGCERARRVQKLFLAALSCSVGRRSYSRYMADLGRGPAL